MAASSSASANTRAGTRMPATVPTGNSHSWSSMRSASDIEDHARGVPVARSGERQPVVGDGLDQGRWLVEETGHGGLDSMGARSRSSSCVATKTLRFGQEGEFLDPAGEQRRPVPMR